jgi:hypothetical protein
MSKKDLINLEPVFRLKPQRTNEEEDAVEIKFVNYITETDKLGDEPIQLNVTESEKKAFGANTHFMGKYNGYDITVNAYRNNITGGYLINNQNLPVCSLQFMYTKNIVVGYLFNIFIYFFIDNKKNPHLTTPNSYVGAKAYGKYVLTLDCDKELYDNMNQFLTDEKLQEYATEDVANHITQNNIQLSDDEIVEMIQKNVEEKKEFYKSILNGKKVTDFKTIKKFVDEHLIPLYNNPHIGGLIKFALDIRAKKRVKEYGGFEGEYKIPSKVLKLEDIKNNPDLVDKYLGIESDSDEN